jgi:hypothetical protein
LNDNTDNEDKDKKPETIEEFEVIEPSGNVISFTGKSEKKEGDEEDVVTFKKFLEHLNNSKREIEHFVFIGVTKEGEVTVSAKAENNLHLYWIVKRFEKHIADEIFS